MHIAVCDDNLDELSRISSLLEDYYREVDSSVTYEAFHNATDLIETMKTRQFDLLLLDILMPGVTGMDAAKEIRNTGSEIPIIFLTSSREYAVESYRVGATDYILKPACKDEIFPSISKQLARFTQEDMYLTLKTGSGIVKLPFSQIIYVEVINRSVQFVLTKGEVREAYGYLADYESDLLSYSYFLKPHRSYIVNLRQVTELNKKGFVTTIGKTVPVARDAFPNAKAVYMKYLLSPSERRTIL
ncbi:response regulator transcription factor [Lachnospiraceae bacterium MD1]|uniref:Stage 0 sporulation protein A homolog n=1 Tax=Variimorphobacter saccharofermentans TaxID=2755051 RepID=A0A839K2J9_9FIRM|nr:LytTR family DNA-binding domain-containing protein [Variimorphobacter saccharofermentans]MBB2184135.1 response regulator transcription factor [Variimorphobacter saccharofermentans]